MEESVLRAHVRSKLTTEIENLKYYLEYIDYPNDEPLHHRIIREELGLTIEQSNKQWDSYSYF